AGPVKAVAGPRLEEFRLSALEDCIAAEVELGRHAQMVGELWELVLAHPLRERLAAHLMLALERSGRRAEALDVYQMTRKNLVAELGVEPGAMLRRMQLFVLSGGGSVP